MSSMADLMKNLGWIAWCLTVIGWFLSPIISLLVNKLFAHLVFDASKKIKELENDIIRNLKKTLSAVEEQTVLRAAEDKKSQSDLKILDSMMMDLKSALYEAEDILHLLDYHRIEKRLHHVHDDSVWVENQLAAACAWIALCKGSWFGRWIDSTFTAVMKSAQSSMTRQKQLVIQGWLHSMQNIKIAGAAVVLCAQSWYQQLGKLLKRVALRRSGVILPVSTNPTCLEPRCSEFVPAEPALRLAEGMVHAEERMDVTQVEDGEAGEIQHGESSEGGQVGDTSEEEIQEISEREVGETLSEEKIEEVSLKRKKSERKKKMVRKKKEGIFLYCARYILTWYATACFYLHWSYGIVGIKSDKKDASAIESLVGITERIRLKNRIKHIEDSLNTSKTSDLLNDMNSSSGTAKDNNKECSSERKEIADMHRNIDQQVFGREDDRTHISNMLRDGPDAPSKHYSVIGIHGITGYGKTTLARYVCKHEKDAGHFNPIMFIHVGQVFSLADIFCDMLEEIKQSRSSGDKDLKSLKTELGKILKVKRFLLVLDDVWVNDDNQKKLEILLDMLNSSALSGSRVLVTAQNADAAQALGAQKQFSIPDLKEKVYLSLFMHHAQPDAYASVDDRKYKRVGCKIAKRLHQSPIAAVTVGKQLKNKSIRVWETTAKYDVLDKTMGALWWSYQQLGVDIRRCFAYCSIFPKGYRIKRDELVRIWIAQGFVNTRSNATEEPEDVGRRYFDELLAFSFVQARRKFSFQKTEIFTVHDLLHELAEKVCGSEFFRIGLKDSPKNIPRGVHHLFIQTDNVAKVIEKTQDFENLRTLFIKEPDNAKPIVGMKRNHELEKVFSCLFMRLRKLRVLVIKVNCAPRKLLVPASIDRMKHLCYLSIKFYQHFYFVKLILPKTFSKLYHIHTIYIPSAFLKSCADVMANLIYLRHISTVLSCPNIGRLTSLQTLKGFRVQKEQGYGLNQLMCLDKIEGTLRILGLGIVRSREEASQARLTNKERLRGLALQFDGGRSDPLVQAEVLEGLLPPKDLQELRILLYKGSWCPSWMLSRGDRDTPKQQLHTLALCDCSQLESIPECSQLFSGLRELSINRCDWESLPQNMERLESLQVLLLENCNKIELLPTLPLQSLEMIEINGCEVLSKTCREVGHTNWSKIQHIPEIWIDFMEYKATVSLCTSDNTAERYTRIGLRSSTFRRYGSTGVDMKPLFSAPPATQLRCMWHPETRR